MCHPQTPCVFPLVCYATDHVRIPAYDIVHSGLTLERCPCMQVVYAQEMAVLAEFHDSDLPCLELE